MTSISVYIYICSQIILDMYRYFVVDLSVVQFAQINMICRNIVEINL